ncbi:sulfur carrier protein ThiS adenylyltransferase ThiF [Fusobacterium nucleatum subsp. nucleatum ATCC 23726]|uniref:Sulfur carrier protein ThiS adenylyltransferase ThiF n=3 Tax=Fusobacterium nucleatum subsp. nucleatum TaxID=76856 RepID=A0ABM6TNJ5_FUSNN|nr:sulfur carrier protein ThiS adenylyltransferase ThiF [Fusobacterium nucleatum]AVQ14276.1 sulfur carrier protein ThiS adenylyltransferase ThiF [Fusobacterium nucleatum subsp. nucleatum ATCC 25586]AVQ22447.1 sulfur carrier protein ThiS adenylyltransferase ThiF [Fusobacterium nucleatum subsp. nucleatum ATCC 23726]EFG94510.1 thiamine biosynthesis protein ThiF [Fusobacterium nucleatum subsp. nucleatum ATCC 23726]KUL99646.1 thiamine biosynthesis protein ThiF [Fusobacterium nucleatum subsp. nucleat
MELKEEDLLKRNVKGISKKLKKTRVCILGLGGLGSNVVVLLARSGIGSLKLVDFDIVEASNLNRQQYRISHIGLKKTEAMKSIIREINPFVEVDISDIKVDRENIYSIVGDIELVVEAFDRAETKAMTLEALLTNTNKIVVSASGMAGLGSANEIVTRKIKDNFYLIGDNYSDYEEYSGIMSTRVMICAAHQANMVLRLILEEKGE